MNVVLLTGQPGSGKHGIGHTWKDPPGGRCLTCMTGWNTRQGEGKCPYPLERRLQEIADRDEGVDMRLSPDLARWILDRLRTPTTEPSEPVVAALRVLQDRIEWDREAKEAWAVVNASLYAHPVPEDTESAEVDGYIAGRADPSGEVGEEDVDAIADVLLSRIVTGWRTAYIGSAWRKAEVSIQGIEGAEREWAERAAREILARLGRREDQP